LQKIARECDAAGVRYGFDLGKLGFSVIFYRTDIAPSDIGAIKNGTDNGTDGTDGGTVVNAAASLVLEAIKEDNQISVDEIIAKVSKSRRTVLRAIATLKDAGMLRRIGSERNGNWEIVKGARDGDDA
jgi:predicted HTH transcriptional regulator